MKDINNIIVAEIGAIYLTLALIQDLYFGKSSLFILGFAGACLVLAYGMGMSEYYLYKKLQKIRYIKTKGIYS